MKHENNAGLVLASLMAILSSFAVAGVFDDAHFLFYGGVDRNGNGAIDKNDIYDYRHYTNFTSKTATFQIYLQNNFTAAEKQQAFSIGNETVRLATAGITLENEPCIRWHQYDYTEDDVGMTKYSFLQSDSGLIPNAESYTFIMRFRPISLGKAGTSCAFLNFGNKWNAEGMYLYTQVNDSSTGGCIKYAIGSPVNANVSSLVLTNGVWHEVVMVLDGPNRKITIGLNQELGFDWRGPSYGHGYMLWYTRTIPESTTGWSFTPIHGCVCSVTGKIMKECRGRRQMHFAPIFTWSVCGLGHCHRRRYTKRSATAVPPYSRSATRIPPHLHSSRGLPGRMSRSTRCRANGTASLRCWRTAQRRRFALPCRKATHPCRRPFD